jgi:general stress protein YciG
MAKNAGVGKGWHGDPAAHAAAGRRGGQVSSGNFRNDPKRAAMAGKKGGALSPGNFKNDPERARAAGRARAEKRRQEQEVDGTKEIANE